MLLIVSKIQADSALRQFYNKTGRIECISLSIGITNDKNTQVINI